MVHVPEYPSLRDDQQMETCHVGTIPCSLWCPKREESWRVAGWVKRYDGRAEVRKLTHDTYLGMHVVAIRQASSDLWRLMQGSDLKLLLQGEKMVRGLKTALTAQQPRNIYPQAPLKQSTARSSNLIFSPKGGGGQSLAGWCHDLAGGQFLLPHPHAHPTSIKCRVHTDDPIATSQPLHA